MRLPLSGLWLPLTRTRGPRLSWAESVQAREAERREAETGQRTRNAPHQPPETLLRAWYGPKKRHVAAHPIDWTAEVDDAPHPDLG